MYPNEHYGEVITEKVQFYEDEPVFVVSARQPSAPQVVREFALKEERRGSMPGECVAKLHILACRMEEWQQNNPTLVDK